MYKFEKNMYNKIKAFLVIMFVLFSLPVIAGTVKSQILNLHAGPVYGAKVFIEMQTDVTNKASCSSDTVWDFALNMDAPGAKETYAIILLAYSTNRDIRITGSGNCSTWPDIEELQYVH